MALFVRRRRRREQYPAALQVQVELSNSSSSSIAYEEQVDNVDESASTAPDLRRNSSSIQRRSISPAGSSSGSVSGCIVVAGGASPSPGPGPAPVKLLGAAANSQSSDRKRQFLSAMRPTLVSLARRGTSSSSPHQNKQNNNNNLTAINNTITTSATTNFNPDNRPRSSQLDQRRTVSTPTTPSRPLSASSRIALSPKDHNASVMNRASQKGTPLVARSGNDATASMAFDKQKAGKPMAPILSVSASKAANKAPLTPRVAASNPPLATTPMVRRGARPEQPSAPSNQDLSTPLSSFLAHNVTPRSGSRKSRLESPTGTPTGTPQGTPAPEARVLNYDGGVGASGGESRRLAPAFSPPESDVGSQRSQSQVADDSKFFYASDAKPPAQTARPPARPTLQNKQSNTFFYANGSTLPPPTPISSGVSTVGSTVGEDRALPKFFHANGTPDVRQSPNHFSPAVSSVGVPSPRLAQAPPTVASPPLRPASPIKAAPPTAYNNLKKPSVSSPSVPRPALAGRQSTISTISTVPDHRRKVSIEVPQRPATHEPSTHHAPDNKPESKRLSSGPLLLASLPTSPVSASSGRNHLQDGLFGDGDRNSDNDRPLSMLSIGSDQQSPIRAGHSLEHMNELAAQARRERKVLDLEIRNSSLESINRTLERQMRKQTAELRRYRRLSRSGRLSIATATSGRNSTGTLGAIGEDCEPFSDMSEEEEEEVEESEEESDFSEELDEGTLSPAAIAANDAKHRKKDEKRLLLDLSKHQQLLVDSQKMNQSLKRCLGWTEELINEGKKALAYRVRPSDVELGGRVLIRDELEAVDDEYDEAEGGVEQRVRESMNAMDGVLEWDGESRDESERTVDSFHATQAEVQVEVMLGERY